MRAGPFRSAYHGMAERRRKSLTKAGWLIRLTNDHSRLPFVTDHPDFAFDSKRGSAVADQNPK
jgi:hypothetical protein